MFWSVRVVQWFCFRFRFWRFMALLSVPPLAFSGFVFGPPFDFQYFYFRPTLWCSIVLLWVLHFDVVAPRCHLACHYKKRIQRQGWYPRGETARSILCALVSSCRSMVLFSIAPFVFQWLCFRSHPLAFNGSVFGPALRRSIVLFSAHPLVFNSFAFGPTL